MSTGSPERPDPYAVELALAAALQRITDQQTAAIAQSWARAWSEVSADLLDALAEILTAGGRVNTMAVVRYERLASVLAVIADQLEALVDQLGVTITADLAEVLAMADQGTAALIAAQVLNRRDLAVLPAPPDALAAIIERTTQQITSTSAPLADETYAIIVRELTRGVAAGDNPRETAARMVERAEDLHNFGRARAENIARTETLDAHREAARVSQDANADVLAGWVWLAHLGDRTCRSCLSMHGRFFELDVPGPHDHPQGRCSRTPVVAEEDGTFDLSWVPSAAEHFDQLTPEQQRAILGRQGYDAWVTGDFPIEKWTKNRETTGWRDSQVPAGPGDGDRGSIGTGTPSGPGGSGPDDTEPPEPPRSIRDSLHIVDANTTTAVEDAADAIDQVHLVPADMTSIDVLFLGPAVQLANPGTLGRYFHIPGQVPHLELRRPPSPMSVFTTIHELGHALDELVFGTGGSSLEMATKQSLDTDLADWWGVVQTSTAYTVLQQMADWDPGVDGPWIRVTTPSGANMNWNPNTQHAEYLLRPAELFARAYCQWIIDQAGNDILRLAIERKLGRTPDGFLALPVRQIANYPEHWEPEDFTEIAEALRRLFENLGLLT